MLEIEKKKIHVQNNPFPQSREGLIIVFHRINSFFTGLFFLPTRFLAVISKRNTEKTCNGLIGFVGVHELQCVYKSLAAKPLGRLNRNLTLKIIFVLLGEMR